ncbi:MAG: hypothetical protein WC520_00820 [Candidatus Paceibacterota bacterium]
MSAKIAYYLIYVRINGYVDIKKLCGQICGQVSRNVDKSGHSYVHIMSGYVRINVHIIYVDTNPDIPMPTKT